jgi:hypothetical protein
MNEQQGSAHPEFDRVAGNAAPQDLAHGLSEAFRSDQTPPFSQMVSHLFGHSDGQQKAGLLNSLFAVSPQSLASEVLGMVRGAGNQGGKPQVTPEQAQQVPPEAVEKLAAQAHQNDPSVVDKVSDFYAQHPNVIKTLGVGALTFLTSRIVGGMRGRGGGA